MRKHLWKFCAVLLLLALTFSLAACSQSKETAQSQDNSKPRTVKLGCVPTTEPVAKLMKEALEKGGNTVEIVMFDGNNMPATALKDGNIDAAIANHVPWLKTFSKENNTDLQMVQPYYYYSPFRIFSTKYQSIDQLPVGAKIIIPNDPANQDRSIRMLAECKLVKLGEKKGNFYTKMDIIENPKKLELIEVEVTTTARSIRDVDAVFSMAFIAQKTGNIDPNVYLYEDPQSSNYQMGLIVKGSDVNAKWAVDAMKLLKTDDYKTKFNDTFKGAFKLID